MPLTKVHKQETRARILEQAIFLFSTKGFDQVSIDELMSCAGLTRGGFYAHFKNKNELYVEAILNGVRKSAIATNYLKVVDDNQVLNELVRNYLAQVSTVTGPSACPLAFLVTDVANREAEVRDAYTISFKGLVKILNRIIAIEDEPKREAIARSIATLMIGGVAVGRALNDPQASQELIDACYKIAGMLAASA
ncbi:TetR/AcrR family transcriptional regulator [Sedimenticola selenatireducens]|uniref:TetR/AcrR family transcriptional regulator n=1 Tax=Sedimenticola selenatireducens TaxID=191960 RepID=UPI0016425E54|nr:TetR/AcrR family transcriptional regulator [Sedimenticola selenatireducens]